MSHPPRRALWAAIPFVMLALSSCASYQPVPAGYAGPTVNVADSGASDGATTAQIFAVTEVDGHRIGNSFAASAAASQGRGFALTARFVDRDVPAQPMKLTLRGSTVTAAPIQAIAMQVAGTYYSVEGGVDFRPVPGAHYVVKGELGKQGSSVWVEDAATGEPVTDKVRR